MDRKDVIRLSLIAMLLTLTVYRCFSHLASEPVQRWDEQTNIGVVTDSLSFHSLPILYRNNQPFLEKPPLWYVVSIAIGSIAGVTPVAMRITSAVSGIILILLIAYLSERWWGQVAGGTAWIVLLTTNHLFATNPAGIFSTHTLKSADIDSLYLLLLVLTFAASTNLITSQKKYHSSLAGVLTGLTVLTKGPFGFVPLFLVSVFLVTKRKVQVSALLSSWVVSLLILIPWHAIMVIRFGQTFISEYGVYHLAMRTLTSIEGHGKPLWYYFSLITHPVLFPGFFLLPIGLLEILKKQLRSDIRVQLCFYMAGATIIIPTIMQTKLAWYVLPFYPFAALFIGAGIANLAVSTRKRKDWRTKRRT